MNNETNAVYPNIHAEIGVMFEQNGLPMVIIPNDCDLKTFPELQLAPPYIARNVVVTSASSFLAYYNRFANNHSTIFVDIEKSKLLGIMDYHEIDSIIGGIDEINPKHCKHTVTYDCPLTPEAKKWFDNNKKPMNQADFAAFIEDGILEISQPSGAEMLEIATTLQAKNAVNFRSSIRLDNGQVQMGYEENLQGSAGVSGQITIPQNITLILKVFRGDEEAYQLKANFRYRIKEGQLTMWYELIRHHIVREDAVKQILETIKSGINFGHIIEAHLA